MAWWRALKVLLLLLPLLLLLLLLLLLVLRSPLSSVVLFFVVLLSLLLPARLTAGPETLECVRMVLLAGNSTYVRGPLGGRVGCVVVALICPRTCPPPSPLATQVERPYGSRPCGSRLAWRDSALQSCCFLPNCLNSKELRCKVFFFSSSYFLLLRNRRRCHLGFVALLFAAAPPCLRRPYPPERRYPLGCRSVVA